MKAGGSLPRGRRRLEEVPAVPAAHVLSLVERAAQTVLIGLVEQAGGRYDPAARVEVGEREPLIDLFNYWAEEHGRSTEYGLYFSGRPGLWHALDELYPLQDPNRWDRLREAVIAELEQRNWVRRSPPRGAAFDIHR